LVTPRGKRKAQTVSEEKVKNDLEQDPNGE